LSLCNGFEGRDLDEADERMDRGLTSFTGVEDRPSFLWVLIFRVGDMVVTDQSALRMASE